MRGMNAHRVASRVLKKCFEGVILSEAKNPSVEVKRLERFFVAFGSSE